MAQTSFPFEDIDTTETEFSQWARNIGWGVVAESTSDALEVAPASAGLAVDVEPGRCMVRGHFYVSTAVETLALDVADSSLDRVDTVVLELDPSVDTILLEVVTGTPGAGAPSLTQTDDAVYQLPLANVLVPANAGVPGTITDRREFIGTRLGDWTTAGRPNPAGRILFGFNRDLNLVEIYDGTTWRPVGTDPGFVPSLMLMGG